MSDRTLALMSTGVADAAAAAGADDDDNDDDADDMMRSDGELQRWRQ
jgi:hypothetical protein